ncbi:hypothetical protein Acy02nite_12070 [Actinoplanes cyaneus]|uniref:Clumping factor A n=1 Tax=Actinoplanes cyaneus TaxID=52696 RepID=A0A919IFB1_9ACTN|nr:hypothetical protein [Actinoplanes cyaneus]MCW2137275.1 clumping factor A [Actinoplanes cyaneus]GID63326.1 hypothetical protein Acy02nite_12070 [Actinoplanes cyaneus]
MIPASFPLILVAVVCLAIGLIRGSSSLLIASIVANLLVAVVLVVGLRQRAAARHADAPEPADPLDDSVPPGPAPRRTAGASDAHDSAPAGAAFAADSGFAGDSAHAGIPASEPHVSEPHASDSSAPGRSAAAGGADPIGFPAAEEVYGPGTVIDQEPDHDLPRTGEGARAAGTHLPGESVVSPAAEADYRAASSTIGAARRNEADEQAWRRPAAPHEPAATGPADSFAAGSPGGSAASGPGSSAAGSARPGASGPGSPDTGSTPPAAGDRAAAFPAQGSGADPVEPDPVLGDEFGEPDADDPDDEPLPQSVRPTDAVRVARLGIEVLVVDGRPRFHMADCPHLVGRLTESLPAAEAVELGFSPCGLCRPVDRLLGVDAHR